MGRKAPVFCSWFVTHRCNLKCRGCIYYEGFPKEKEMDTAAARALIDGVADAGIPFLIYLGGEPLVRRDIHELTAHAGSRGIYQVMFTNGIRVDEKTAGALCRDMAKVIFSIDGPERANDWVRGKGSFARAMGGLKTFLEKRSDGTGCYVSVGINRRSWPLIPEFLAELRAMGVDRAKLQPNFLPGHRPDEAGVGPTLSALRKFAASHPGFMTADERFVQDLGTFLRRDSNLDFCGATMLSHIAITADGTVSACCDHFVPLGHVRDKPLKDILKKDHTVALRKVAECPGCVRQDFFLYRRFALDPLWTLRPADFRALRNL
ncbi:MAG: radical SAM protein [Deltaproteobacteria bacterium]|nr:radical SAM protein [Deltaproteobacteria bacterium]